jgi:hypothetical protein
MDFKTLARTNFSTEFLIFIASSLVWWVGFNFIVIIGVAMFLVQFII